VRRVELPSRTIEHFGSTGFTHSRAARSDDVQVSLVELDGVIGGHEAASQQLLVVLAGRVSCSTRDEHEELGVGEAVLWQEGEWHETRSHEVSHLLIVEGAFA
jgi:mannose-6-phosphate isomerase-like protein (cupin superfamily)